MSMAEISEYFAQDRYTESRDSGEVPDGTFPSISGGGTSSREFQSGGYHSRKLEGLKDIEVTEKTDDATLLNYLQDYNSITRPGACDDTAQGSGIYEDKVRDLSRQSCIDPKPLDWRSNVTQLIETYRMEAPLSSFTVKVCRGVWFVVMLTIQEADSEGLNA